MLNHVTKIFLLISTTTLLHTGCLESSLETGQLPSDGVHRERIDYAKARQIPGTPVIQVPEMNLDLPAKDPPKLSFPEGLRPGFPVALEGVVKAPDSVPNLEVYIEFHSLGEAEDPEAEDLPLSQSGITIGENEKGMIRYRLDLRLPHTKGKHRFRIGAVVKPGDTEMVGIAQGVLAL